MTKRSEFEVLRKLHLENLPKVDDLLPLVACTELSSLSLVNLSSLKNFSTISYLPRLSELKLRGLQRLDHLSKLSCFDNDSTKSSSPKVLSLWLSALSIDDLTPLEDWRELNELHITDLSLRSLKPLANIRNLRKLHLDNIRPFGRLDDLIRCNNLEEIYLGRSFYQVDIPQKLLGRVRTVG